MKKIIYYIATAFVLGGATACTDILDTAPSDKVSGKTMWTTESNVDQGIIGVYFSLQKPVQGKGIVGDDVSIGYYGFEAFGMTGQGEYDLSQLFSGGVNAGNDRFSFTWKWCYDGINRANDAIVHIPAASMLEAKKARLVAECKVLRAFFYMRLNELFGNSGIGVPIYLEPVENKDCTKGQSPEADVWALIIQDLTDAINEKELPNNQINGEGRANKGAAYAFRGRAYLMTKEYDKAIADFAKVGEMGYSLYTTSTADLPAYKALFKLPQERCQEMIFSVQYIDTPGYGSRLQKYFGAGNQGGVDVGGSWTDVTVTPALVDLYEVVVDANTVKPFRWADYLPNYDALTSTNYRRMFFLRDSLVNGQRITADVSRLVKSQVETATFPANIRALYIPEGNEARLKAAYANRDPRLALNVVTPYANFLGIGNNATAGWYTMRFPLTKNPYNTAGAEPNANPSLPATYYASGSPSADSKMKYIYRKFVGEGIEYKYRMDNPIDEPIIRYADVLLMWAEALVEKNDLNGAMAKVKQVRDRANVPTMASSFADKTTAQNYVRDERRREFMGEGVNFFDEMRWRTLKQTKFDQKNAQFCWGGTEAAGSASYEWPGDYWYTWPVPKGEIEMNPNLKKTPGWPY